MRGSRVGQILVETYRIDRLIAEGGMGSVYEASHLRVPKRFAVKFLNLNLVGNAEAQARFRREAEIIAALDHPNIVGLLDFNVTDEGVPFIVLEYLDGEHLGKRIARGKLSLGEALRIFTPTVHALSAAHARGVVHRDLKPENIVLIKDGSSVKVVDFGIAKIRDGQELTANNTILGTVPYMAPEQLFGTAVDARTDEFALASILYEMLSGEMAFGATGSVPDIAARVAHHQPPYLEGIPRAVSEVVLQAMAKLPEARFPSVLAFLEALSRAARLPDEAPPAEDAFGDLENHGLPPLVGEPTSIATIPTADARHEGGRRARPSLADEDADLVEPPIPLYRRDTDRLAAPAQAASARPRPQPATEPLPTLAPGPAATMDPPPELSPLAALSTVQINKSSVFPSTGDVVHTGRVGVSPELLQALSPEPNPGERGDDLVTDRGPAIDVPQLKSSARGVWIIIALVLGLGGAALAWLFLTRWPH